MLSKDHFTQGGVFISAPAIDSEPRHPSLADTQKVALGALRLAFGLSQKSRESTVPHNARQTVYLTIEQHTRNLKDVLGLAIDPLHEALLYPAKQLRQTVRDETSTQREIEDAGSRLNHFAVLDKPFSQFDNLLSNSALIKGVLTGGRNLQQRKEDLFPFYFDLAFGSPGFGNGEWGKASFEEMLTADFLAQKTVDLANAPSNVTYINQRCASAWRIWLERQDEPSAEAIAAVNLALKR